MLKMHCVCVWNAIYATIIVLPNVNTVFHIPLFQLMDYQIQGLNFSWYLIAVIVFIVHSLDEEILINQKDVPDVIIGDVVEIYHIEDEER